MNIKVVCGRAEKELPQLASESIQLVVTSPPYDRIHKYNGHFKFNFTTVATELYRVLCPGGVLCWNVGDSVEDGSETLTSCKQKIFFREQCGFRIHDTMIYEKLNFGHPERSRYHQAFEYVFVLSKGAAPRVFNPIKDKPNAYAGTGTFGKNTVRLSSGVMGLRRRNIITPLGMRTNVWRGKTRGQEELCRSLPRPSMMPKWLARDLILSWSQPGDTILDCFGGSGTTALQAAENQRYAIHIDSDPTSGRYLRSVMMRAK